MVRSCSPRPRAPTAEHPAAATAAANHGRRLHYHERVEVSGPYLAEENLEYTVGRGQPRSSPTLATVDGQLMAERGDLKRKLRAAAELACDRVRERGEKRACVLEPLRRLRTNLQRFKHRRDFWRAQPCNPGFQAFELFQFRR